LLVGLRPFFEARERALLLCFARPLELFCAEFRDFCAELREPLADPELDVFRRLLAFVWAILTPPSLTTVRLHPPRPSGTRALQA